MQYLSAEGFREQVDFFNSLGEEKPTILQNTNCAGKVGIDSKETGAASVVVEIQ